MSSSVFVARAVVGAALAAATLAAGVAYAQAKSPSTAQAGVLTRFGGPASGSSAFSVQTMAATVGIDVTGIDSIEEFSFGDPTTNFVTFIQLAPFAEVTGSAWNVVLTAFGPSWSMPI